MHPIKYIWAIRAVFNKPFFKHIGNFTYIGKPCFIEGKKNISIGARVRIFPGVRMEAIDGGKIDIGDNVAIEQNVHLTSGGGGTLSIGSDSVVLGNSFITNIDHDYEDISKSVLEQQYQVIDTQIGEGCFIGYGAAIQAGTILGKHCIVGTNTVVRRNFPDYCVIVGVPGKVIKRYDINTGKWIKS